jgi:hypothetical protein
MKVLEKIKCQDPTRLAIVLGAYIMSLGIVMSILGAIFPNQFERLGLGFFLNRKSGVFGNCMGMDGRTIPSCAQRLAEEKARAVDVYITDKPVFIKKGNLPFTLHNSKQ